MKTHWKKLDNPDFIGAWAFQPDEKKIVTIKVCRVETIVGSDGKKEQLKVVHFQESEKPLICKTTNAKAISKVAKSDFIEDWVGCKIELFVQHGVKAFGDIVDAVRVTPKAPRITLPELTLEHPKWDGAVKSLSQGNTTIEGIKKHFKLSESNEAKLNEAIQGGSDA